MQRFWKIQETTINIQLRKNNNKRRINIWKRVDNFKKTWKKQQNKIHKIQTIQKHSAVEAQYVQKTQANHEIKKISNFTKQKSQKTQKQTAKSQNKTANQKNITVQKTHKKTIRKVREKVEFS